MSRSTKSRSTRWRAQHGRKLIHWTRHEAQKHADALNRQEPNLERIPYPCFWQDAYAAGEAEVAHWHVGRRKEET